MLIVGGDDEMELREMGENEFISLLQQVNKEAIFRYGSFKKAMLLSGIKDNPNQVYSNEEIFAQLKKVEVENGYVNLSIYEKSKYKPTHYAITSRFGTFAAACELARVKFIPNKPRIGKEGKKKGNAYPDEQIFEALKTAAEKYGGSLTIKQYKDSKLKPSYMTILQRYHSFQAACHEAGVNYIRYNPREIKIEEITTNLHTIFLAAGRLLTTTEYTEAGFSPRLATIYKHGITWIEAIELAGFDYHLSKASGKLVYKAKRQQT